MTMVHESPQSVMQPVGSFLDECFGCGSDVHDNNVSAAMEGAASVLSELSMRGDMPVIVPVGNDKNAATVAIGALIGADWRLNEKGADTAARETLWDYMSKSVAGASPKLLREALADLKVEQKQLRTVYPSVADYFLGTITAIEDQIVVQETFSPVARYHLPKMPTLDETFQLIPPRLGIRVAGAVVAGAVAVGVVAQPAAAAGSTDSSGGKSGDSIVVIDNTANPTTGSTDQTSAPQTTPGAAEQTPQPSESAATPPVTSETTAPDGDETTGAVTTDSDSSVSNYLNNLATADPNAAQVGASDSASTPTEQPSAQPTIATEPTASDTTEPIADPTQATETTPATDITVPVVPTAEQTTPSQADQTTTPTDATSQTQTPTSDVQAVLDNDAAKLPTTAKDTPADQVTVPDISSSSDTTPDATSSTDVTVPDVNDIGGAMQQTAEQIAKGDNTTAEKTYNALHLPKNGVAATLAELTIFEKALDSLPPSQSTGNTETGKTTPATNETPTTQEAQIKALHTLADKDPGGWKNRAYVMEYLLQHTDLNIVQISGLIGNFCKEVGGCDLDPGAHQTHGPAIGVAQWDSRKQALLDFAEQEGMPWDTIELQAKFIVHELKGNENAAYKKLLKTNTLKEATDVALNFYERPAARILKPRFQYAKDTYNDFANAYRKIQKDTNFSGSSETVKPSSKITKNALKEIKSSGSQAVQNDKIKFLNTIYDDTRHHHVARGSYLPADPDLADDMEKAGYDPESAERYDCLKNVTTWARVTFDDDFNSKGLNTSGFYNSIMSHDSDEARSKAIGNRDYKIIVNPSLGDLKTGDMLLGKNNSGHGHAAVYVGGLKGKNGVTYSWAEAAYPTRVAYLLHASAGLGWMKNNLPGGLIAIRLVG